MLIGKMHTLFCDWLLLKGGLCGWDRETLTILCFVLQQLRHHILQRLLHKIELGFNTIPLNLDYLEFICRQELYLLQALSNHVEVHPAITQALQELFDLVRAQLECPAPCFTVEVAGGTIGRPKILIGEQRLKEMLHTQLPVPCIAKLMGVSRSTIFRRMEEYKLSVRNMYSSISDDELDNLIASIKNNLPNAGYRMVRGRLESIGHRVQWRRIAGSMHRVDSVGIISRLSSLGCVVRRVYSVPGPLSLVHVDTNHKLIRFVLKSMLFEVNSSKVLDGYFILDWVIFIIYIGNFILYINYILYPIAF